MLKAIIDGEEKKAILNLPTKLDEVSADYLTKLAEQIEVADHYSLIGICYREKLTTLVLAQNQHKKSVDTAVIPIFIKAGYTDNEFIKGLSLRNKIVIASSDIAIGQHVNLPGNVLSPKNVIDACNLNRNFAMQKDLNEYCYLLEFKIVPNNAIKSYYTSHSVGSTFGSEFISVEDK